MSLAVLYYPHTPHFHCMEIVINYYAVLASGVAALILGQLWYGPLFGKAWMRLSGMTMPESITPEIKRGMAKNYSLTFVMSLVTAFVLAHGLAFASAYTGISSVSVNLLGAFWIWLGFTVPVVLANVLWSDKGTSWKLFWIHAGYYLVSFSVMATILTVWK